MEEFSILIKRFDPNYKGKPEEILNSEELSYYHSITHKERQLQYLQTRFAIKTELKTLINVEMPTMKFNLIGEGKPVLENYHGKIDFNISHSHDHFAIIVSDKLDVGIDIEVLRSDRNLVAIAEKMFSKNEAKTVKNIADKEFQMKTFTKIWAAKEAILKCAAGGVFKNVHDIEIDTTSWEIKKLPKKFGPTSKWSLSIVDDIPGFMCAIALRDR